ncbi:BPSL0067 family protein [Oscillatoria sp. HE19RPO]|uniref:BPSL0067 family protein n=1 Tax=Oscillatoria sp. HE19RPO TaxID=2954806 RepID=UPI0020C54EE2|nr:BPSL0067 family protein [Oscillatoria sp. HE19RPO]
MLYLDIESNGIPKLNGIVDPIDGDILKDLSINRVPIPGAADPRVELPTLGSQSSYNTVQDLDLRGNYGNPPGEPDLNSAASADLLTGIVPDSKGEETDLEFDPVTNALAQIHNQLQQFASSPDFQNQMNIAFGNDIDVEAVQDLADNWSQGIFNPPVIDIVNAADINRANGAFAVATNTIYLSREFVTENAGVPEAIAAVLLEEIGHDIDRQINISDAAGDEGFIFAGFVQGTGFDAAELQAIKAEDDTITVMLDGQAILIEQSYTSLVKSSPGFTKNIGGWTDNNNYPRVLGDVNGDGRVDIVGFGASDVFVSLGNSNGSFGTPIASKPSTSNGFTKNVGGWSDNNNYPRLLADVNGDGRADIIGFGASDVFVSLSNGNGTFRAPVASSPGLTKNRGGWSDNNNYPRLVGDVNGDGRADIVGFGTSDVFVSFGNSNGTFGTPVRSKPSSTNGFTKNVGGWSDNNNYPRLLADVNGDGRADIVGFGISDVFVSLSNGNGTFRAPVASSPGLTKNRGGWTDNNNYPRLLRDVNGDNRADIVGFGASDVFVSLANSDGTFRTPIAYKPSSTNAFTKNVGGWTDNNNYPRLLGDINGDRKADIIGFGATDVFASLSGVAGTPTPPPSGNTRLSQLLNGSLTGQYFDVDRYYGAQCWDLVAYVTGQTGSTTRWRRGTNVMSSNIPNGTAIATFLGPNGSYDNLVNGKYVQHTGIFAGYGTQNGVRGFYMWEQNAPTGSPVRKGFYPASSSGVYNANNYHVIQFT